MVLILSLAWLNYFGVKVGGEVQVVVTVVKGRADCLYYRRRPGLWHSPWRDTPRSPRRSPSAGFFAALVAALWAYDGWNNVSMVASEIREPAAQSAASP